MGGKKRKWNSRGREEGNNKKNKIDRKEGRWPGLDRDGRRIQEKRI